MPPATFERLFCNARPIATPAVPITVTIEVAGIPSVLRTTVISRTYSTILQHCFVKFVTVRSRRVRSSPLLMSFSTSLQTIRPTISTMIARIIVGTALTIAFHMFWKNSLSLLTVSSGCSTRS